MWALRTELDVPYNAVVGTEKSDVLTARTAEVRPLEVPATYRFSENIDTGQRAGQSEYAARSVSRLAHLPPNQEDS